MNFMNIKLLKMKRKILSLTCMTIIVFFSVFCLSISNKEPESDLQLKNLIAMSSAQAEDNDFICCALVSQMECKTVIYPFYWVYYGYPYFC